MPRFNGFRSSCQLVFVALFVFSGIGCSSLPSSAVAVLEHADAFEIYALEPNGAEEPKPGAEVFHGHAILVRAEVKDRNAQEQITEIVNHGVRKGGTQAKCFNPRHGIHATRGGHSVDLVICYECSAIEFGEDGYFTTVTTGNVQADLDDAFRAAGVSRP